MRLTKFTVKVGTYYATCRLRKSTYQMRMWLPTEGRTFECSLDTGDEDAARERATDKVMDLVGKIKAGKSVSSVLVSVLLDNFLAYIAGTKSVHTIKTQRGALRHGVAFIHSKLGDKARVTDLDGKIFRQYPDWRGARNGGGDGHPRLDVTKGEMQYIRQAFKWAANLVPPKCAQNNIPDWGDFKVETEQASRDYISMTHWNKAVKVIGDHITAAKGTVQTYNRALLYWYMKTLEASGLRTMELYRLQMKDVETHDDGSCTIFVRGETSKVGKSGERRVEVPAKDNPLSHWMTKMRSTADTSPTSLVFCSMAGRTIERVYLDALKDMKPAMKAAGVDDVTPYYGRHMFITKAILAGISDLDVSLICGTGTDEIRETYYNVKSLELSKKANAKIAVA